MLITGNMRSLALSANDRASSMDNMLRSEVYGGDWNDDVGYSYLAYTETVRRTTEKLVAAVDNLESVERSLETINEFADKEKLEKLKAAVKKL